MPANTEREVLLIAGHEVVISNPGKVLFPDAGHTKRDLVHYYVAVAEGALRGAGGRPNVLVRYPNGIAGEFFYQKRAPQPRPDWIDVVELQFPSGRTAEEVVPRCAAALAWMANLGCLELHPHPVRADDLDHPDELRVDLDPVPGVEWQQVRDVARIVQQTLETFGLTGWPKTSGSRGMHVCVRIDRRWTFVEVRRAALALAREVERRVPRLATSKWWKEERHGVFVDYNQNAKDRTVASAYSVRPKPDARVSAPLSWDEIDTCDPAEFTLVTMPSRFAAIGDRHRDIDRHAGSIERLLELSARHEREGVGDAPWPPQYAKQPGEPPRVQPSRRRSRTADRAAAAKRGASERTADGAAAAKRGASERTRSRTGSAADVLRVRATKGSGAKPRSAESGRTVSRRTPRRPLIEIGRARRKEDALAGLARWRSRHPEAAAHLEPADVLVDAMRGRSSTWTRVRVNLQHVPAPLRPAQEPLDPDDEP
jgi:bifunctional non-homologous end joining protein LigD